MIDHDKNVGQMLVGDSGGIPEQDEQGSKKQRSNLRRELSSV
jgi:hypothetical protein